MTNHDTSHVLEILMAEIGEPQRRRVLVPHETPAPNVEPVRVPQREPVKVPEREPL